MIEHTADIQPVVDDSINMPSLTFTWRGESWNLVSTTSYFSRDTRDVEDSTEGTAQYWETTIPQGFAWTAHHKLRQISHETRLAFHPPDSNLSGTIGFFHARSRGTFSIDRIEGLLGDAPGTMSLLWEQMSQTTHNDRAMFTELDYKFAEKWTLTLGDRYYWLDQSNDLTFDITSTHFASKNNNKDSGHTPKLALSYQPSEQAQVYASGSQGFRAGGAQLDPTGFGCESSLDEMGQTAQSITKIKADTLTSIELGGKIDFPNPGLLLSGSLFRINWDRIQQPLFLASCGFYLQGNAGAARINGGEFELAGHVTPAWKIRAGAGYQDARITKQGLTGQPVGSRVYQTPKWNGTLGNVYTTRLNETRTAFGSVDSSYTGDSISANAAPGINLKRQGYALVNARAGVGWDKSELALNVHNVGNSRPNLGDIGYIGYTRWVDPPANTVPLPQVVTLPPRNFMIQYRQSF
ncbi:MAG TPA: TonB-dependent receptor [Oligoflexus sp.]|uniref:TonB-dependent receptor n=1 Tax=Oligoflexus sp. TaxID=1971216 RepID=UPI002D599830|nr:TonB-dependent receptor [Oligoflexus sp.]HYX33894.1 TonB-dependent receptor [Oligoflexus sp.]